MANRRMFARTIVRSSRFVSMPVSSRELYFQSIMDADDDGFVEHTTVMNTIGASTQDLQVLYANKYLVRLDEYVSFIVDWFENNQIRRDRYHPSIYLESFPNIEKILQEAGCRINKRLPFGKPSLV